MPGLPLLLDGYTACTFAYGVRTSANGQDTSSLPTYHDWLEVFRKSIPTFHRHALSDESVEEARRQAAADVFAAAFGAALDALAGHPHVPLNCAQLCALREQCLRAAGLGDIFQAVKQQENAAAAGVLPNVLAELDSHLDTAARRLECALRGVFAGNIFDLGAASSAALHASGSVGAASFVSTRNTLLPRPWVVDNLEAALQRLLQVEGQRIMMFVDNAGSDVVLGMLPLARELLKLGARQVVLVANEGPTINDITASELTDILPNLCQADASGLLGRAVASGQLRVQSSGSSLPVIDLAAVSAELCEDVQQHGCDLLILEGMGRSIETNLNIQFKCDSLKLGMVKHPEVAACLKGRLYDCVCCFTPGATQAKQLAPDSTAQDVAVAALSCTTTASVVQQ